MSKKKKKKTQEIQSLHIGTIRGTTHTHTPGDNDSFLFFHFQFREGRNERKDPTTRDDRIFVSG